MKQHIFIILLGLLVWSCEQNDIALYDQEPKLNFLSSDTYTFSDRDYLQQNTKGALKVKVQMMGNTSESPLSFCMKAAKDTTNGNTAKLILLPQYVLGAGQQEMEVEINVERPKEIGVLYSILLVFDYSDPTHEFGKGNIEQQQIRASVIFKLQPKVWNDYFGIYSNAKYLFMMDHWKQTIDAIAHTSDSKMEIRTAYTEYKRLHGPLYDDQTPKQEITFPL